MKKVVIGILGASLDRGLDSSRWNEWRPTLSLVQHEELLFDRLDLIYQPQFEKLLSVMVGDIHSVAPETKLCTHKMDLKDAWDFQEVFEALYDFAAEYNFDTDNEEYYVHISTGTHVIQICMFLLTESRHLPAKLIQTSPPSRRQAFEPGKYTIIDLDLSQYDRIAERFHHERSESQKFLKSGIDTRNSQFNQLIEQIEHVAMHSKEPILLQGPTGAGKTLLARKIYELKKMRRQLKGRFVEVNCATIRGDAAMSTLFGHRKGAFTGAVQDREGLLRHAEGGLLFLDEIGELGMDEQTMLLRAIEEKRFLPLGSDVESESHFQLICGTNRDLRQSVAKGSFREDLLARINLWSFHMPGLAERRDDIEPNIHYELEQVARREGKSIRFNKEAFHLYLKFAQSSEALWLYNFRDLSASITRMATLSPAGRIQETVVRQEIIRLKENWVGESESQSRARLVELIGQERFDSLDRFQLVQLLDVIDVCGKSETISDAGRVLFSKSRNKRKVSNDSDRLRKYLLKFGLSFEEVRN